MIPLPDPGALPLAVRALREAAGQARWHLAVAVAAREFRRVKGVDQQWHDWEMGNKSPILSSLPPYLDAHRVRLALIGINEQISTPWCPARHRAPGYPRCAVVGGHAGRHRTYAGVEFQ